MLSPEAAENLLAAHELYDVAYDLSGRRLYGVPLPQAEFERLGEMIPKDAPDEVWEAFDVLVRACPAAPVLTSVPPPDPLLEFPIEAEPNRTVTCPHCGAEIKVPRTALAELPDPLSAGPQG